MTPVVVHRFVNFLKVKIMPIGVGGAALIAGGASLLGTGANAMAQGKMNKKTIAHNNEMWWKQQMQNQMNYQQQRSDALSDWRMQNEYNEGLWNKQNQYNEYIWRMMNEREDSVWSRQNEYNSPAAQMARFKEAGLNPHLIYGQGNVAGSIGTAPLDSGNFQSSKFDSPSMANASLQNWSPRVPDYGAIGSVVGDTLANYVNFRQQAAQTNNLEATNDVIRQQAILTAAQATNEVTKGKHSDFDLKQKEALNNYVLEAAQLGIQKTSAEINSTNTHTQLDIERGGRESIMQRAQLSKMAQEMLNMKAEEANKYLDNQIKLLDLQLKSVGLQPTDNIIFRIIRQNWEKLLDHKFVPRKSGDFGFRVGEGAK